MNRGFELYRQVNAIRSKDFNKCFYCGCIASHYDYVPPKKYAEFYLRTREEADFYQVPSCQECIDLLKTDKSSLLAQRVDKVKAKLSRKYQKALRVYEMWDVDEVEELDYQLQKSIKAGINLGQETYERCKFKGFDFESEGEKHSVHYIKDKAFTIFGEEFNNFRDALDYGSKSFRIPKAKLRDLFAEHDNNFDKAIRLFQEELAKKLFEKELKQKCKTFAEQHKQNIKFVMHTVELYMKKDETLTIDTALDKLLLERFKSI